MLEVLDAKEFIGSSPCPVRHGRPLTRSQTDLSSFVGKKKLELPVSDTGSVSVPLRQRLGCPESDELSERLFMANLADPLPPVRTAGKKRQRSKVDQRDFWGGSFKA